VIDDDRSGWPDDRRSNAARARVMASSKSAGLFSLQERIER